MNAFESLTPPRISLQPVEDIRTYRTRQGSEYVRKAAAIMKTAFEVAGETENATYKTYAMLLRNPTPTPGHMKLASVAMQCFGRVIRRQQGIAKVAAAGALAAFGALRGAAGGALRAIPEGLGALAFLGGAAGATAGGSLWALNRSLGKEDQKNRELEIQRDTYRQLASEVQEELKRRNMAPTPENQAAAVDYLT